ncbi:SRPBCC family protein [Pseudonocardia sp. Ae717_Ps2]|uniref:SRPBCC family protein n=2 Tax=Pseudonocardia TaxID=1847 RepID=UPI00130197CC|nr:SRPBCC family protein [Pseudonocardia sp. Ae717_Ps2]
MLDHDVDRVWAVVRDFHGLALWQPAVAASAMGAPAAGRAVRVLTMADGATVVESLAALDDSDRSLVYEIVTSPYPVQHYRGRLELRPVTSIGATFIGWSIVVNAHPDDATDLIESLRQGILHRGLRGLAAHLDASTGSSDLSSKKTS